MWFGTRRAALVMWTLSLCVAIPILSTACKAPNPLMEALNRPQALRTLNLEFGPNGMPEPIYEVTIHPVASTATITPTATIHLLPRRNDPLQSAFLRINFNAGSIDRNAWIVASPSLLNDPVNWGTQDEPVLQLIPFDVILPFPALRITDYTGKRWHRQPTSALVELHDDIRLFSPMYLQLIVQAPEENELGFVAGDAYGLIPGG